MKYDKLVRDLIPDIIAAKGQKVIAHFASQDEYELRLRAKLQEEVTEFLESGAPEELADIMEVVHALGNVAGLNPAGLEKVRAAKAAERGGFEKKIILEEA
jgi:predicted house-cleaning noncanonical NTP pyrophosphatase (MazG superfamily)